MRSALIISVDQYSEGYPNTISGAVATDARTVSNLFRTLGIRVAEELGGDGRPVTFSDIKKKIASFLVKAGPEDDVVVYYTGHGLQSDGVTYLIPSDADPTLPQPLSYLVPVGFADELAVCRAKSVTFIIDACRSGSSSDSVTSITPSGPVGLSTTYMFATSLGEAAGTSSPSEAGSLFTQVLCEVLPSLHADARVATAELQMQTALSALCQRLGKSGQHLEVITDGNKRTAPFPLFAASSTEAAQDRWSRLITTNRRISPIPVQAVLDPEGETRGQQMLHLIDGLEHEAPDTFLDGEAQASFWADPDLLERLTRALAIVRGDVTRDVEWLALLGLVGAIEASFREAEQSLVLTDRSSVSFESVLSSEPVLARAVAAAATDEKKVLETWVQHLAAVPESVSLRYIACLPLNDSTAVCRSVRYCGSKRAHGMLWPQLTSADGRRNFECTLSTW